MEQLVSSGENSPVKQKFRRPQVARFRLLPNVFRFSVGMCAVYRHLTIAAMLPEVVI